MANNQQKFQLSAVLLTEEGVTRPRLRGRWLVLAGILLTALSARPAVMGVAPILPEISRDLPFDIASLGVLGMLPTAGFAVTGFLTPRMMRRIELEPLIVVSLLIAVAGQLGRTFGTTVLAFLALSLLTMVGLGVGNILLPPLVKRYFPDHIGLVTALYMALFAFGTALTPQLSVPLTEYAGWRFSAGIWSAASAAAALLWIIVLMRAGSKLQTMPSPVREVPPARSFRIRPWRSPVSWGLSMVFAGASSNAFAMFVWLPTLLTDQGMSAGSAGSMLALFALTGLPVSLLVPSLLARVASPLPIALLLVTMFAIGYVGLLLSPTALTAVWVILAGLGQGIYSYAFVTINMRTRTTAGSGALSGFSQGMGYSLACSGPLFFGILHDLSGSWAASFAMLCLWLLVLTAGLLVISRGVTFEDRPGVLMLKP
ncbi:MFS transporter [Arthrobacter bambusae]|uniref:MFS transporter n=1 Tax=Arthrobacter bambusae TaxID=1338426 RepID=UPI001F511B6F|nr:MFS transporter [Arthrobacter bambusae]MCI0144129.1 MFS transporter [Arthrobacter bambusae]